MLLNETFVLPGKKMRMPTKRKQLYCETLRFLVVVLLAGVLVAGALSGCSSKGKAPVDPPPVVPGNINITVDWLDQTTSRQSAAVQSVLIEVFGLQDGVSPVVVNRPQTTHSFSSIPVGVYAYTITAYAGASAAGAVLGRMESWLEVKPSVNTDMIVNPDVDANVISMVIRAPMSELAILLYDQLQLKVEAYDGKGRVLLLPDDPFLWQVSPGNIAEISQTGVLRALALGQARVEVTEKRSMRKKLATIPVVVRTKINPVDGAEMVYIPPCSFLLGDNAMHASLGDGGNCPETEVHLTGYYIYKYEVTVRQYKAFCDRDPADRYTMPASPWLGVAWEQVLDHPMVFVTWYEALAYAQWVGGTLPGEAQWERAAQGSPGKGTPYAWGIEEPYPDDLLTLRCRYEGNADKGPVVGAQTAPVGYYRDGVSPESLYDMAGNAWEWCMDWFYNGAYADMQGKTDPVNYFDGDAMQTRTIRGGAFNSIAYYCRSSYRFYAYPDFRYNYIAFRVIVPAPNEGKGRRVVLKSF